jgi:hypothetical protein
VYENKVLRIFGLTREEVLGGLQRLYKQELQNLYTLFHNVRLEVFMVKIQVMVIWVLERGISERKN